MPKVVLLGPQRLAPTIGEKVQQLGLVGPVALITAGWQEREGEDEELKAALGLPAVNLRLYERWEDVRQRDPAYFEAHRKRQDRLRQLQELYRFRLQYLMEMTLDLLGRKGDVELLEPERQEAVAALRALDDHHLARVTDENRRFEGEVKPAERPAIARHRGEVRAILEDAEAVAIAGGHVAILQNRLRLFDVGSMLRRRHVLAWSGGAMCLTDRVVLFHDFTADGPGNPEVMDRGERLVRGVVVMPHARHRVDLQNRARMSLLARRFHPARVVPMDERQDFTWDGETVHPGVGFRRLSRAGDVVEEAGA